MCVCVLLSWEPAKMKLLQAPSSSVLHVFESCTGLFICQASPYDLWRLHTEAHFLSPLWRNEKQRAVLSSARNNAALAPHGSLIGPLLYIQTFDLHKQMYSAIGSVCFSLCHLLEESLHQSNILLFDCLTVNQIFYVVWSEASHLFRGCVM